MTTREQARKEMLKLVFQRSDDRARVGNILSNIDIATFEELASRWTDVLHAHRMGRKSLNSLSAALNARGFTMPCSECGGTGHLRFPEYKC